jgi:hypothetical protein
MSLNAFGGLIGLGRGEGEAPVWDWPLPDIWSKLRADELGLRVRLVRAAAFGLFCQQPGRFTPKPTRELIPIYTMSDAM